MRFSGLTIAALSLAAFHARAGIIESRSQVMKSLLARQSSQSVCVSECATLQNALDACMTFDCWCTASVANGLNSCINCYWESEPTQEVLDAVNELITVYGDDCADYDLPPISVTTGRNEPTTSIVILPITISTLVVTITPPSTTSSSLTEVPTTSSTIDSRFTPVFPETEIETVEESTTEPPTTTSRTIQQETVPPLPTTAPPPSPSEDAGDDADGDIDGTDDVLGGASSQRQSLGALAAVVAGAALLLI